jgi:uncharacterized protein (DUF1810 family)
MSPPNADIHDLARFVQAQNGVYEGAVSEIRRGRKVGHWMWFIFPQLAGLGASPTARRYAIHSLAEAQSYLAHPVLGPRLRTCATAVAALEGRSAAEVFGSPDDLKLCSSLTLFEAAAPGETVFGAPLDGLCQGRRDPITLRGLQADGLDAKRR